MPRLKKVPSCVESHDSTYSDIFTVNQLEVHLFDIYTSAEISVEPRGPTS